MKAFGKFLLTLVLLPASLLLQGQTFTSRDSLRGVYRHYDFSLEGPETPAPKGYKPFYISHYGRHGSRYPVDRDYLWNIVRTLQPVADAGLLSELGLGILDDCHRLDSICRAGVYGDLSERGALEHRTIARNMARRWKPVFRRGGRVDVLCSYVPRCIHSMENFTSALSEECPRLRYSIDSSEACYAYLVNNHSVKKAPAAARLEVEAAWDDEFWQPFYRRLFTDPEKALKLIRSRYLLCEFIYTNGSMVPLYAPDSGIDLMSVFTDEEFRTIYEAYNDKTWGGHCNSVANGDWRIHRMDSLLISYVAEADAAIAAYRAAPRCGSPARRMKADAPVATLRFGHDTSLMPLLSLMGVEGFHRQLPTVGASAVFNSSIHMTMGANLIMVFYSNRSGDVLVKFVHSGRETRIPALSPYEGPYYHWDDVRSWFLGRVQ